MGIALLPLMMTGNSNSSINSSSENPLPPLPLPRVGDTKNASIPSASASSSTSMSTPFPPRTLQPIGNRTAGHVNATAAAATAAPAGFDFLKSPTTLTFERMIEACTYDWIVVYYLFATEYRYNVLQTTLASLFSPPLSIHPSSPLVSFRFGCNSAELIDENPGLMKKVKSRSNNKTKYKAKAKPTSVLGGNNSSADTDGDFSDDPIEEIQADEDLHRRVVLLMALQRQPAEKQADSNRAPSSLVIREGFFWREYPVCEQVLYDAMAEYYQLSCLQRQSKLQQEFNNALVERMRLVAHEAEYVFEPTFSDKKLRDRIRCFFKTHQQNAKKRLVTLIKHADSDEHTSALRFMIQCVRQGRSLDEMQALEDLPRKIRGKERPPSTTTAVGHLVLSRPGELE
jgi:hypothetical protein